MRSWLIMLVALGGGCGETDPSALAECVAGTQDRDGDGLCTQACAPGVCGYGTCDDSTGHLVCTCQLHFAGAACDRCEPGYSEPEGGCEPTCEVLDCGHGTCATSPDRCVCDDGYSGDTCAECAAGWEDPDADGTCTVSCGTLVCGPHGSCVAGPTQATCACETGYTGAACEDCDVDYAPVNEDCLPTCAIFGCEHGTCEAGAIACTCDLYFTGPTCGACFTNVQDTDPNPACGSSCPMTPCHHGVCDYLSGPARCSCDSGFGGDACDLPI